MAWRADSCFVTSLVETKSALYFMVWSHYTRIRWSFTAFGPLLTEPLLHKRGTFDSWNRYVNCMSNKMHCVLSREGMDVNPRSRNTAVSLHGHSSKWPDGICVQAFLAPPTHLDSSWPAKWLSHNGTLGVTTASWQYLLGDSAAIVTWAIAELCTLSGALNLQ